MGKKLYVGSLSYNTTETDLAQLFAQAGEVDSVHIITDRETGRAKGFGFVEMVTDSEADRAITMLNGTELDGRTITVNQARPQETRGRSGDNYRRGGYR